MASYSEVKPLKGKVAIITGSSQGIGSGIAIEFARSGADVCINFVGDRSPAEKVAEQVKELGQRCIINEGDVGKREDVDGMVEETEKHLGPVNILVTNAITSVRNSLLETKFEDLERTVSTGIFGVFHCMQVVARKMVAAKTKGCIVHITSPHARAPFKDAIDYNIAKSASHHLAMSAANELMWHGIRVNLIEPGWTVTPGELKFYSEETLTGFGSKMPLGRMEYPVDLGKAAVFLCSADAEYITGAHLKVDGGQFMEGAPSWNAPSRHDNDGDTDEKKEAGKKKEEKKAGSEVQ